MAEFDFFKSQEADESFQRAQSQVERTRDLFEMQGETMPEASPGLLSQAESVIDAAGAFTRGALFKAFGVDGFQDKSFLDAALANTGKEKLYTADALARSGILAGDDLPTSIARGAVGFVGDVVLDPLSWVSLGGTAGAKIAGKALSTEGAERLALMTEKGFAKKAAKVKEFISNQASNAIDIDEIRKLEQEIGRGILINPSTPIEELRSDLLQSARSAAEVEASQDIGSSIELVDRIRDVKSKSSKLDKADQNLILDPLIQKENQLKAKIGLGEYDDLSKMFEKPQIRYTSPLAGLLDGTPFENIPIVSTRNGKIPIVSEASGELYDLLSGPLYNARNKITDGTDAGLKALEDMGGFPAAIASGIRLAGKAPKLLSRTLKAGSAKKANDIEQHSVARIVAKQVEDSRMDIRTANMKSLAEEAAQKNPTYTFDFVDKDLTRRMELALTKVEDANASVRLKGERIAASKISFEDIVEKTRSDYEAVHTGMGDEAAKLMQEAKKDFDYMKSVEMSEDLLGKSIENYVPMAMLKKGGGQADSETYRKAAALFSRNNPDPSMERFFATSVEAVASGLEPDRSFFGRWKARGIAHKYALEEKNFATRLSHEYSLPQATRLAIGNIVAGENQLKAKEVLNIVRKWDFDNSAALAKTTSKVTNKTNFVSPNDVGDLKTFVEAEKELNASLVHPRTGKPITYDQYDLLRQVHLNEKAYVGGIEDFSYSQFQKTKNDMGLTFSAREDELIKKIDDLVQSARTSQPGRAGESAITRIGSDLIPDNLRKSILKNLPSEVDRQFFGGVLPRGVVQMVVESKDQKDIVKEAINRVRDPEIKKALGSALDSYDGWLRMLRMWVTMPWAAYHARNLFSAQVMGIQEASVLGESFNLLKLARNNKLRHGEGFITQANGIKVSGKQLIKEAKMYGLLNESPNAAVDVINAQAGIFGRFSEKKGLKQVDTGVKNITNLVENYGREQLFFTLREKGMNAQDAAIRTNEIMVNYARGKTPFERDVLNRIMFFYSFARANTANQVISLFTKPGAITAQMYGSEAIRQILLDPEATPLPPGLEEQINTSRGTEGFGGFVGRSDATGNPLIMTGTGMPIEDVARMMRLKAPKSLMPQDLLDAGVESFQETGKTLLSQTNPMINQVVQLVTGKNYFFDREITDKSMRKMALISEDLGKINGMDVIPKEVFQGLNEATRFFLKGVDNGDGTITASPTRLAVASLLIPGFERYRSTANALAKDGTDNKTKLLRATTGIKVNEIDPERSLIFDERNRQKEFAEEKGLATSRKKLAKKLEKQKQEEYQRLFNN